METLPILSPKHIEMLFRDLPVGDFAQFEHKFNEWKKIKQNPELSGGYRVEPCTSEQQPYVRKPICSVHEMLSDTQNGKLLLSYYAEKNTFSEEQRNLLIGTIAKYIESKGYDCSFADCSEIEKQICKIFPTESLEFYVSGKRGKLYHKIYNLRRQSRGILTEKSKEMQPTEVTYVPESDADEALKFLRSKDVTNDELDLFWRKCAQLRFSQIAESKSTKEVLEKWPEYITPSGLHLVSIDFNLKYPKANDFPSHWHFYESKLINLLTIKGSVSLSKKLQELEACSEESKTFALLWNCHMLFPPNLKVVEENGSKRRKKFSIADSQSAFAIMAQTPEEMKLKLNLRKIQGSAIQPCLLVIGSIFDVKQIFIYFDGNEYPITHILTAVDLLYKIFFVFNLQYPEESELFYPFLESFFL